MSRYVDLSERVTATYYDEQYEEWDHHTVTIEDVLNEVCDDYTVLPTIEPRKKGKWIEMPDDIFAPIVVCSRCNQLAIVDLYGEYQRTRYCPNCGADMRGEQDDKS